MSFVVGDKVKICHEPLSLLKTHADKSAELVKKGFGQEWLIRINGDLWWAKEFDFEKEEEDLLPFSFTDKMEKDIEAGDFSRKMILLKQFDRLRL